MNRRFLLANATIVLDEVVYLALVPLLPTYVHRFHLSAAGAGLLYGAYPMLGLVSGIPAGLLCDRIGPRRMLLASNTLFVIASAAFALATSAEALWLARAMQGLASGASATAGMAMVTGSSTHGRHGRTIGLAAALQGLSALGGPALGGLAVPAIGERWAFAVPAVLGALVVAGLALDPPDAVARADPSGSSQLGRVVRSADARAAALCFLAIGVVGGCVQTLAPLQLGDLGVSARGLGLLFIAVAVCGFPIVTLGGRFTDAAGVIAATRAWVAIMLVAVLVLGAGPGRIGIAIVFGVFLSQIRVGGTIGYVRGTHAGDDRGLASGFGLIVTAWAVGASVGPVAAGAIVDASGYRAAYLASAIALLALTASAMRARRDCC
jgi:predicted MFS family arabinose efflux permease